MPDIRLQDYTAKIKELIRNGSFDEAIAHCQHILRHYPKFIEVYCLLGEACLEKGMYREAIEFFQRTLSADPENFIARVGLGVIYGEQGALPEAIWQMERAFELAPGNAEVRHELQRLYAQRNGGEKPRLKLTPGALARLYARNGSYERAIQEFRAILRQDPDLPDIKVALLEALWREGRRLEAVECSLELLEVLPNCLKANLILGEIWTRGGHEEAGWEKLRLANALDPENLVAHEVMGDEAPLKLQEVYIPELTVTPDLFAAAVLEKREKAAPPAPVEEEVAVAAEAEPAPQVSAEPWEQEVPDWLLEMGAAAEATPLSEVEAPVAEGAPPEVPEWLRESIGEAVPTESIEPPEELPAEEIPDWLRQLMSYEQAPTTGEAIPPEEPAPAEVPAWLLEVPKAEIQETPPVEPEPPLAEAFPPEEEAPPAEAEVPESLKALVAAGLLDAADLEAAMHEMSPEALEAQRAEKVPDWLKELIGEQPVQVGEPVPRAEEMEPVETVVPPPVEEAPLPTPEVPESLKGLVAAGLLDEADLESAMKEMSAEELEAQRAEAVPDWLRELMGEKPPAPMVTEPVEELLEAERAAPPEIEEAAPPEAEELPAWLAELQEVEEEALPVAEEAAPAEAEELPAWLAELREVKEEALPVAEEAAPAEAEELPAWLAELREVEEEALPIAEEVAPAEAEEMVPSPAVEGPPIEFPGPEAAATLEEVAPSMIEAPAVEVPSLEQAAPPLGVEEPVKEAALPLGAEPMAPVELVRPVEKALSRREELVAQLKERPRDYAARLELARLYQQEGDWNAALNQYEKLISARKSLPDVIQELNAMQNEPVDRTRLYQLLGDAYMQNDQLNEALEMYRLARQMLTKH